MTQSTGDIVVKFEFRLNRRSLAALVFVAAVALPGYLYASSIDPITGLTNFQTGTTIVADEVNTNFQTVALAINDNDTRIGVNAGRLDTVETTASQNSADIIDHEGRLAALEATFAGTSRTGDELTFSGMNVNIRNGHPDAKTDSINGLGNLVVGYNENTRGAWRGGSHTLVIGPEHEYSSYGGFVAGNRNHVAGPYSSVSSGRNNIAIGDFSSILGGETNQATGIGSSISGGGSNVASGPLSSVLGGDQNHAEDWGASVAGGAWNHARGGYSHVSGGAQNYADALFSSISGGDQNTAALDYEWRGGAYHTP